MNTTQANANIPSKGDQSADQDSPALLLEQFAPFENLSSKILDALRESSDFRDYAKGETIISHGQYDGETFFLVAGGSIKVTITNPRTGAMFIETIECGGSFGLDIVLSENKENFVSHVTLNADTDSQVWLVDAHAFNQLIQQRPSVAKNILYYMSTEIMQSRFQNFEFTASPEVGVFSLILSYASRDDLSGEWKIENMPKHRELAQDAGVEEVDAANAVAVLIQEKIARRDYPGLIIDDMAKLEKLTT